MKLRGKKQALSEISATQSGYFTAKQASHVGYGMDEQGAYRLKGSWLYISKGLYRLPGYEDTLESEFIRWCLWSRDRNEQVQAVVSHASALYYHALLPEKPDQVHLTVPRGFRKKIPDGIIVYRDGTEALDIIDNGAFRITTCQQALRDCQEKEKNLYPKSVGAGGASMTPSYGETSVGRGRKAGFTLVELLVVVAIISILAGLLLPMLNRAVESARQTQCKNNLRQIYLGFLAYADKWSSFIPPRHCKLSGYTYDLSWHDHIAQQLEEPLFYRQKGIFSCPTRGEGESISPPEAQGCWNPPYGINAYHSPDFTYPPAVMVKLSRIAKPTQWLLVGDASWFYIRRNTTMQPYVSSRHSGGLNLLYFDGHASRQQKSDELFVGSCWDQ
jgi:prepilin-type N-terminal cleavage/methylation domain-containing protein/prepilin-type processing-associated H-X9-DG protein